jgi:hypothetical protein
MKLTIIRLVSFTEQDHIDLAKVWPEYSPASLEVDETHRIYAARFNDRLLGAVRVTLSGTQAALDSCACVTSPVAAALANICSKK